MASNNQFPALQRRHGTGETSGAGLSICDGANVVARMVGRGYPIGVGNDPDTDALANLFCAAPELLAAGKQVLRWIDSGCDPSDKSIQALRDAVAQAETVSFGASMALALQARTKNLSAWNHTDAERHDIARAYRNGAGLRLIFRDGSAAFIPKGSAEVQVVA